MLPPPSTKLIAHVDMNSYFASVEQQANVELRGKPLGVCSYLQPFGCVIAASIEAKRRGMKVGMNVKEARKLIPDAIFVENDPPKYRAVTSRVFSILHELTDSVEHYSIDEAFLDLTGWYRDSAEAAWALAKVRARIRDEVGDWLRCSIGIAPTRFLAKTASDMEKPNGLVVIHQENLDEMLAKLDLEDVCGIGPRTRKRLNAMGIQTLLEIKCTPIGNLMRAFGKGGLFLWCKLHAMEFESLTAPDRKPKSVGHSYCVPDRVNREGKVPAILIRLTERAGRRMRALGMLADSISISVGFRGPGFASPQGPFWTPLAGEGVSASVKLGEPADDSFALVGSVLELLRSAWHGERVNFIALTLHGLSEPNSQGRLDDSSRDSWVRHSDRRSGVSHAVDQIRDRYGENSIVLGGMLELDDEAPERIGFRKTEGVDVVLNTF
jgi:DNA polymerase-4